MIISHIIWSSRLDRIAVATRAFCIAGLLSPLCVSSAEAQVAGYRLDFGASTAEPGYVAVDNTTPHSDAVGYGWVSPAGLLLRDRNVPDDLRTDFIFKNSSGSNTFRVSNLTPGLYLMKVICGDNDYGDHVTSVSVPGAPTMPTLSPRAAQYITLSATVTVSATGALDITFGSPNNNWVVNALSLEPSTTTVPPTTEYSYVSEWDESVFATDPTTDLLAKFTGVPPPAFTPTALTRANYLTLIAGEVDFWKTKQNSSGAIIDPYRNNEVQYSTPAFAQAAATAVVYGGRSDLLEAAAKAMDWASGRLKTSAGADGHDDFYPPMLAHAFRLLENRVSTSRAATWRSNLNFDPYAVYGYAPGSFNWNVVASAGEALLQELGLRSSSNPYVAHSWGAQGRHFTSPYGFYMEGPMAYDHFPRIFFADALAQGYDGAFSSEAGRAMDRAAIASLFMQSSSGELPAGGRSAHHQWNEAEQCFTYEIYAAKAKAAGNTVMAAAYKRAAHLALSSMRRWVRPSGEMQIVKNWVNPASRHGYESYSYHSQYNLLPMAMLSAAYEYAEATEDIAEGPSPADCGGYVFKVDGLDKVFANAGGTCVELDTSGDHHYDATGLIRIHRKGVIPQLGPSDSLLAASSYTTPNDSPITTGVGVSWQDSTGSWRTLGEMSPTTATVTPLTQTPDRVTFDVTYSGGLTGVTSVTEHYFVTSQGVQLTTEVAGYTGPLRYVWPVLSNDGKTTSTITVSGKTVSVTQGDTPQTFHAPGAQSVRVESSEYSNHNGWARLGIAEFPSGGAVTLLIGDVTPTHFIAGALHVDLRANASSGAGTSTWTNYGTLGNFTRVGNPALVSDVANTGRAGVLFSGNGDAYTSIANAVTDLEGSSDRTIEVWAYNPEVASEESLVSWGRRGATRASVSLNFGNNSTYGASTHFNDDLSWRTIPSPAAWHHLAYVYSGSNDVRVYVDGVLSKSKSLGGALATTPANPINIGAQRNSDGTLTAGLFYSGYINSLRIHGGALSAAQVAGNYALGPAAAPLLNQTQIWRIQNFGAEWENESVAGNAADPDHDGISNLLERALGGNPKVSDPAILPALDPTSPLLSIIYRKAIATSDLDYAFEETTDFTPPWSPATGSETPLGSEGDVQIMRFTTTAGNAGKKFLRLRVTDLHNGPAF